MDGPIVFDVDDFCDQWPCLDELFKLKVKYPNFKATIFAIPFRTSPGLLKELKSLDFVEIAIHGFFHLNNLTQILGLSESDIRTTFRYIELPGMFTNGFKSPGWWLNDNIIRACNDAGLWVAMRRDDWKWKDKCENGYYIAGERYAYWHGHTHDVCNNWIRPLLPKLIEKWPTEQKFLFVSEVVVKKGLRTR